MYFLLRAVGVKVDVSCQSSQMFDDVVQGTVERSSDPKLRGSDQRKQHCRCGAIWCPRRQASTYIKQQEQSVRGTDHREKYGVHGQYCSIRVWMYIVQERDLYHCTRKELSQPTDDDVAQTQPNSKLS